MQHDHIRHCRDKLFETAPPVRHVAAGARAWSAL
jgi:hypothetical protein